MDHLPFPQGTKPPIVPFFGIYYDGLEFSTYPRRRKIEDDLRTWTFTRLPLSDYQAFFQTWLYFGALTQIFKIAGLPMNPKKFIQSKGNTVNSTVLNVYLDEWKSRLATKDKDRLYRTIIPPIRATLQTLRDTLRGPLQAFRRLLGEQEPGHPVRKSWPDIVLSIAALGYTLERVSNELYAPISDRQRHVWGVNWVLEQKLKDSKWCKALIAKFLSEKELDFILFVSSTPFPRTVENHDECTGTVCRGRIVDTNSYVTKHVEDSCRCKMWDMPTSSLDIIQKKGIPLACWSDEEGLKAIPYEEDMPYVAISHVWADGKGNTERNALPTCQLESIQAKITHLYSVPRRGARPAGYIFGPRTHQGYRDPDRQPAGFWMDTLCVPVGDKQKDLRKQTISQMREIYEAADRVLVLDDRVQQLPVSSNICDRAARLVVSNWQSRIWTLQEGIMAQQLFFQFRDGALTNDELQEEVNRQRDSPSPDFWQLISCHFLTILSISLFFDDKEQAKEATRVESLFEAIIPVAKNRMTTKLEDETICLATLLRLDARPISDIKSKKSVKELEKMTEEERNEEERRICDGRMKLFLCMVGRFRKSLIFNELPRLSSAGFHWAPCSFLGQSGSTVPSSPDQLWESWEGNSPLVYLDGVKNQSSDSTKPPDPSRVLGLLVTYPGIMLQSFPQSVIDNGQFWVREREHRLYQYWVSLVRTETRDTAWLDHMEDEEKRYAIVMAAAIDSEDRRPIPGVLGILRGVEDGIRRLRPLRLVKVEVVDWERGGKGNKEDVDGEDSAEGEGWRDEDEDEDEDDMDDIEEGGIRAGDIKLSEDGEDEESGSEDDSSDEDEEDDADEKEDEKEDEEGDWQDQDVDEDDEEQSHNEIGGNMDALDIQDSTEDNDSSDDMESNGDEEDDKYAIRTSTTVNKADRKTPKAEQVVFGKILFSRNNKWCIL